MFEKIKNHIQFTKKLKQQENTTHKSNKYVEDNCTIYMEIDINLKNLKKTIGKSSDVIFKEFTIGVKEKIKAFICVVDFLVDKNKIEGYIKTMSMFDKPIVNDDSTVVYSDIFTTLKEKLLYSIDIKESVSFNEVLESILSGSTVIFIDGYNTAFIIGAQSSEERSVNEPNSELSIRGSREGFVENIKVNISLIRKIIRNPNLVFETLYLGKQTHTMVCLAYMDGLVNQNVLKELKERLNKIDADFILESGYIEQYIEDRPFSIFATVGNSEKPDKVSAKILEGRIAILCNGTPCVLTVPYLFVEAFQASEDYYSRPFADSLIRIGRFLAFFISSSLPALYVSITSFHPKMIPPILLLSIASSREGVPFPSVIEVGIMLFGFQVVKESGIRMPIPGGQAVSIIGALIVGQAAVAAGIISNPVIIVVALMGITGFIINPISDAIFLIRFLLLALSATFGFFGFIIGIFIILAHMCSLNSFGTPYLAPFAPTIWSELKDTIVRFPLRSMKSKPKSIIHGKSNKEANNPREGEKP
jgi:spore germination protein KA